MGSVNLFISEIDTKDFGGNFDWSVLDSEEDKQEAVRESVLNFLWKTAVQSSQNL